MTVLTLPAGSSVPATRWPRHLAALAVAVAGVLLLFARDLAAMAHIWWTSTTFGHCLFIPPVIAWLVWQRRAELAALRPVGWATALAWVALGGAAWLAGEAGGVGFARQLGLVVMLQGAVMTLLGRNVARGLAFPLGYALFLVPFGEWLEPPLQRVTVAIVLPLLHLVGVAATSDGVLIHAGRYYFEVAEACSGAKFVIAMLAFGTLVANVCFLGWRRRAAFLAASLIVPVIANGLRAFATIWAADLTSVEAATGFDHIVYGWVFFGLVMAATLALGWRWFDRAPDAPAFDPATLTRPPYPRLGPWPAALLVLAVAAAFPAWSGATAGRGAGLPDRVALPEVAGWHRVPLDAAMPWRPWYPGADHVLIGRYADAAGQRVDIAIALYARQREGAKLIAFGTGVIREEDRWVRVADLPPIAGGSAMRIVAPGPVERVVATWYDVGGTVTADPARVKLATLAARLTGGDQRAMALHLSATGHDPAAATRAITAFLRALGPVAAVPARIGAVAPSA